MQTVRDIPVFGRLGVRPEHERNLPPARRRKGRKTSPFSASLSEKRNEVFRRRWRGAGKGARGPTETPSPSLRERAGVRVIGGDTEVPPHPAAAMARFARQASASLSPSKGARVQKERPIPLPLKGGEGTRSGNATTPSPSLRERAGVRVIGGDTEVPPHPAAATARFARQASACGGPGPALATVPEAGR